MQEALETNPLLPLEKFLENEKLKEEGKQYDDLRLAGYVMNITYDRVRITTNDAFKKAVGGIPRNSFLMMIPESYEELPGHFTLLRVLETAETPLSKDVQQTYLELHKRAMPELDPFTANELQWGALETEVLGMFYLNPVTKDQIEFSGDLNNLESPHKYRIYSPTDDLLDLIVNSMVPNENQFKIGDIRMTECRLRPFEMDHHKVSIKVSTNDFLGTRTALFGKTRLGKSNVVKIITQSIIETTKNDKRKVGQLIFDIDGEYANDNEQNLSLKTAYPDECEVYSFNPRRKDVKPLKVNFYEHPSESLAFLQNLLEDDKRKSIYIQRFTAVQIEQPDKLDSFEDVAEKLRARRKILMFWAVLKKAGYEADESKLKKLLGFDPKFTEKLRNALYDGPPPEIHSLVALETEMEKLSVFSRDDSDSELLKSSGKSGKPLIEEDEKALLGFLLPQSPGAVGPGMIASYRQYHDKSAEDTTTEILELIDKGKSVILDLSNAHPKILSYYSEDLSKNIFHHQETKFTDKSLANDFVQLYFEEAHNLFPKDDKAQMDIYRRIAKEGAKYHIGMIYSTQSVTSINKDLLAQTENFFVAHMSSQDEVLALSRVNSLYSNITDDLLKARTVGYVRMLTRSHRFVVPVQISKFNPQKGKIMSSSHSTELRRE